MKNSPPLNLKWLFFSFKGRIARQSYILAQLFLLIVLILIARQITLIETDTDPRYWQLGLVLLVALLVSAYSSVAIVIKRLHDLNLPWIVVVLLFVPMLNFFLFIFLFAKSSFPQKNEYGEPPFGKAD